MTESTLKEIVRRAVSDGAFRTQLQRDPAKALAGISLSAEERTALTSGDPTRLTALGVDQRMSKAFTAGGLAEVSKVVAPTDATKGVADFIDEGTTSGTAAVIGDPAAAAAPATLVHDVQSLSDLHMKLNEQDLNTGAAAADVDAGGTVRSPMWRIEQDLDTGASGTAAPIDGSPEASAFAPAGEAETVRSPMWRIEQDLNVGGTGAAAPIDGSPEQSAFESADAAGGTQHSANWRVEQDLDAGSSLEAPSDIQITGDNTVTEN